jgi:regulator of cell morphogenesis and NO signaling
MTFVSLRTRPPRQGAFAMVNFSASSAIDPTSPQATIADTVDHIIAVHHGYLRRELPRLRRLLAEATSEAGDAYNLRDIGRLLTQFGLVSDTHTRREEQVTFLLIRQLDYAIRRGYSYGGGLEQSIGELCHEHTEARHMLLQLHELTGGYAAASEAPDAVAHLFRGLGALDADMHKHMELEEQVLFPRALAAETGLRNLDDVQPFPPRGHELTCSRGTRSA